MTTVATDLRARAVKGEDPDKLQIEAYTAAGFPQTTPNTKMEKVRRDTLPPQHEAVMDLRLGEVSEVFSDPAGAHNMIFRYSESPIVDGRATVVWEIFSPERKENETLTRAFRKAIVQAGFGEKFLLEPSLPLTYADDARVSRRPALSRN